MSKNILIVDDAVEIVKMLSNWLSHSGYDVSMAYNGRDALALAGTTLPDLILLDVMLPDLNGLQVCRRLRDQMDTAMIPVILLTAQTPAEVRAEGLLAGANDFVSKPFDYEDLQRRMEAAMSEEARPPDLLEEMINGALAIIPCELAWLLSLDVQKSALIGRTMAAQGGMDMIQQFLSAWETEDVQFKMQPGENLPAEVIFEKSPETNLAAIQIHTRPGGEVFQKGLKAAGLSHLHLIPLVVGHAANGLLMLATRDPLKRKDTHQHRALSAVASQAAATLQNERLVAEVTRREEELSSQRSFHERLLDLMGDGLIVTDGRGHIRFANKKLLQMIGQEHQAIAARHVTTLFDEESRDHIIANLINPEDTQTGIVEGRLKTPDGQRLPVLISRSEGDLDGSQKTIVLVIGDLSEQKRREQDLRQKTNRLTALNKATTAITSSLSWGMMIRIILESAIDVIKATGASILLREERTGDLVFVAAVGPPESEIPDGLRVPVEGSIAGWVLKEARPQIIEDASIDPRFYDNVDRQTGLQTRSLAAVPLLMADEVIGVLEIINKQSGPFNQDDIVLMEDLANAAAVAIQNTRLFEQTQRRIMQLATLLNVSSALSSTKDLGEVFETAANRLLEVLEMRRSVLFTWDKASGSLSFLADLSDGCWNPGEGRTVLLRDAPQISSVLANGQPVPVEEYLFPPAYFIDPDKLLGLPLKIDDRTVGIAILYPRGDAAFTPEGVEGCARIMDDHMRAAARSKRGQLWFEHESLQALSNALLDQSGVAWCTIWEWELHADRIRLLCEKGMLFFSESMAPPYPLEEEAALREILRKGSVEVIRSTDNSMTLWEKYYGQQFQTHVNVVAPLVVNGGATGAVCLLDSEVERTFDREDLLLCQGIANILGSALENARLFQSIQRHSEELEQAYADLQHVDQLRDEMIQNLSHELRTPLTFILSYLDLISGGELGELTREQRQALDISIRKADDLRGLIDNIVSIQQVREKSIKRGPFSLPEVIHSAAYASKILAEKAGLSLNVECPDDLPGALGSPRHIQEVMENLIDNAIKFSKPEGGGTVTVRAIDAGDAVLEVSVKDDGIGIPAEEHEHIFSMFYQVDGGTKRRYGGTGLGLALAKRIVEEHEGRIWLKSAPNQGSTFYFTVPKFPED